MSPPFDGWPGSVLRVAELREPKTKRRASVTAPLRRVGARLSGNAAYPVDADIILVALAEAIDRGEMSELAEAVPVCHAYAVKVGALLRVTKPKDRAKAAHDRALASVERALAKSERAHPRGLMKATQASVAIALYTLKPGAQLNLEGWWVRLRERCIGNRVPVWSAIDVLDDALGASGVPSALLKRFAESRARAARVRTKVGKTR